MKQRIKIDKAKPNNGVLDFSKLLDAPAGKHGFTQVRDGNLYFTDGTRAKFIGFNLPTRSNTPDHQTAERLAERFASMGVNVIRLHAADAAPGPSGWSSSLDNPLIDYDSGSSRKFNEKGLDRFDYFIAKLKEKGIYVQIDLLVARVFQKGDDLDYADSPPFFFKGFTHVNERLIELQKEYATNLLCHVNPYTGLALIDDPVVMTIQVNNEDSIFRGTDDIKDEKGIIAYREELKRRFNRHLLAKYDTRKNLAKAWTYNNICALGEEEDPEAGTVRFPEGSFYQVTNDPMGEWAGNVSPARYADFMEFGIDVNRRYYNTMIDHIRSLGAKVPVNTSNLLNGTADVYSHIDGDIMENNTYFNHPMPPFHQETLVVPGMREYVTSNPLTVHKDGIFMRTEMLQMATTAVVAGKPFILSEWNEYGVNPFHSTAFISMAAYACLNDWDGLMVYCYHTSESWNDQPDDVITDIFDAYNDPSLICQFGFMASLFLGSLVRPAEHQMDLVFTQNDLKTLPSSFSMPNTFLPYITSLRNVFLDQGDTYTGDADVAITGGFVNNGDLSQAKHAVYFSWSSFRDAMRHASGTGRLERLVEQTDEELFGAKLGDRLLVFEDITSLAGDGDYTAFASNLDTALKRWGLLPSDRGLVGNALISDTGEISFDPIAGRFGIQTPGCSYFSGDPAGGITLTKDIVLDVNNDRLSAALLPLNCDHIDVAKSFLITLLGPTGMDETIFTSDGFTTIVDHQGKLYADTAEGSLFVQSQTATLTALDTVGTPVANIIGTPTDGGVVFNLDGTIPAVHFLLEFV
ncbi:cellulase family glycosylhydrolase [Paenibacillus sp. UASWS1643]|uniref:cellulase family glycosylhydrolase n=1 Tax=Paenibacillus sp. UASWS1643 TaxID=2580422 RepID=UPI001239C0EE|nr:cellulase family glycosylhydrolase [Paenibacillus sp. UASWS1643]KAA8745429.1 cellulase family glycosylhydrolase [Paenibacillus sp. UASWS1643]